MANETIAQTCLVMKLAAIMAVVERIPKRGRNAFHGYDYATEADIVSAIRQELASRHVMLFPAITATQREPVGEKGSVLTHVTMEFTFMDGESGETITRPWLGAGTDKEDKGAYKAMTGGEKYFLLKTFLIPTGDDPEHENKPELPAVAHHMAKAAGPVAAPAPAVVVPLSGYNEWLFTLVAIAGAGTKHLEAMWKASAKPYRQQLIDTAPAEWDKLKARAAQVAA